jgi:hypothetical protein
MTLSPLVTRSPLAVSLIWQVCERGWPNKQLEVAIRRTKKVTRVKPNFIVWISLVEPSRSAAEAGKRFFPDLSSFEFTLPYPCGEKICRKDREAR